MGDLRAQSAVDIPGATSSTEGHERGAWLAERMPHWGDDHWWQAQIDAAVTGRDPVLCNLRITLAHQELSLALHRITGATSGANFHTWAVWGSKKAGQTVRQENLSFLPHAGWGLGMLLATTAAATISDATASRRLGLSVVAGAPAGAVLSWRARRLLVSAADQIFGGNVTVLADIGRQTARFVSAFSRSDDRSEDRLASFLAELRPGSVRSGGQDLLRGAYRHYYAAGTEADPDRRDELMLCANLLAILHEHQRLDPYLDAALPRPIRRFVTNYLLSFTVGAEAMKVSRDVFTVGSAPFPETLRTIQTPELESLLSGPHGWDRTPNTVAGSGARDWTELSDRMNFIVDLFRSRHSDPNLFAWPYSAQQRAAIAAGRRPDGPL